MGSVAVIGGGVSGLTAALELSNAGAKVVLYEKEDYLGGNVTRICTTAQGNNALDLNFMVVNPAEYPDMIEFFKGIGVDAEEWGTSFSLRLDEDGGYEWGTRNGLSSVFAQKSNALKPYFWQMLREVTKFKDDTLRYLEDTEKNSGTAHSDTLGHLVKTRGYSSLFQKSYLVPICASLWPCPSVGVMSLSAHSVLSFLRDHHLLEPLGGSQGLMVRWRARNFTDEISEQLERRGCQIRISSEVHSVTTTDDGCVIKYGDGFEETYKECVMAVRAPAALKLLGKQATDKEMRVLGAFQYINSDVYLHQDRSFMPQNSAAWSMWNFLGTTTEEVCLTYCFIVPQGAGETEMPHLVSLNPFRKPNNTLLKWSTGLCLPTVAAFKASLELDHIQGNRGLWFCGAQHGYDFHKDAVKASIVTAHGALRKSCTILSNPKHMAPSPLEALARLLVTRFFRNYISTGCLILLEQGGTVFTFRGSNKKCMLRATLKIHNPQFYWKLATQADLGLADAYIHGDFTMVDENEGLLNLIMILISNRVTETATSKFRNRRGWWTPILYTAGISSMKFFFKHLTRQNSVTQARRNISRHYDLSNDMFSLLLDETMTYSCAVFKSEDEDLKAAQLRKISLLIDKARIEKQHEVLEIGCGWGSLAIEVVKKTGCKYTGITLSEEQLKLAEVKVKESGLQDRIKFLLCDYRQLLNTCKYDRIISCGMLEHVGHEYIDKFFSSCESLLVTDGILVLQFISYPDAEYDEYRRSAGFIKEYIFPGGCLPSLSRVTSAMASSSKLCVEHLENIGIHYHRTLRCWRKNFLQHKRKIVGMGFDEKFIRTWEYYFDYCAAGFKSRVLGDYQIVFSRPGNLSAFSDPYEGSPSAH